jgi:hypothetical protein
MHLGKESAYRDFTQQRAKSMPGQLQLGAAERNMMYLTGENT